MSSLSHHRSGSRASEGRGPFRPARRLPKGLIAALALAVSSPGCMYSFQAGAGFPDYVRTVAIVPFELGPQITRPEIADEIFSLLLREFPRSQGLQPAGRDVADAEITGTIRRYDVSTPSYRAGANQAAPQVLQRQVSISVEVQIVNLVDNEILWESSSVMVQGEFLEESETEDQGREVAIELLVQRIIDGAQSNW